MARPKKVNIRIKGLSSPTAWYAPLIGQEMFVLDYQDDTPYEYPGIPAHLRDQYTHGFFGVSRSDAEVVD